MEKDRKEDENGEKMIYRNRARDTKLEKDRVTDRTKIKGNFVNKNRG